MKVCFIGRGGSGKSTWLVLVAKALREQGREVCVLDADSTNIGLPQALGMSSPPRPLVDYFGGMVFQGGLVTCPVDDPSLIENPVIDLAELPAEYQSVGASGITLLQAGKLSDFGLGAGCDGPLVKLARDVRVRRGERAVDLLVDFKAGLEDTSRGVLVGMDAIVVVCDPSTAGVQTAVALKGVLEEQRGGHVPSTAHLESPVLAELMRKLYRDWRVVGMEVVLNKVPEPETEAYLRERLAAEGITVAACLPDLKPMRDAWLRGRELPTQAAATAAKALALRLEDQVREAGAPA